MPIGSIMTHEPMPAGAIKEILAADSDMEGETFLEDLLRSDGPAVKAVLLQKFSGSLGSADIDDVLAVALNRVWVKRASFDVSKGSLRAWFFRIAHNSALDVLRHGWHRARQLEVSTGTETIDTRAGEDRSSSAVDPARAEIHRVVREIIQALPETQRRIVWADAQHEHGPTPSESLARELQIPVGTVRVYRKRALDRIRKELETRQIDPGLSSRKS